MLSDMKNCSVYLVYKFLIQERIQEMHRKWKVLVFSILALIAAITVASPQSVYAASTSSIAATIQGGSSHLSSVAKQNIYTAGSSLSYIVSKNGLVPNDAPHDQAPCFNVTINVAKTGTQTNTFTVYGLATYFCGHMSGGGIQVNASLACPTTGNIATSFYMPFPSGIYGNGTWSYLQPITGYCEHCTNHIPDGFPFFTVTNFTSANTFEPLAGSPISNPASYTDPVDGASTFVNTGFTNSPAYPFPC